MNDGILNTGLEFWQLIVTAGVLVFSVIAIKISFNFDVNKYLESRQKTRMQKIKNACTHHQMIKQGDKYGLQSLLISPPGTLQWQCQRCGAAKYFTDGEQERMTEYYVSNPEEFTKQEKKFEKLLKKASLYE